MTKPRHDKLLRQFFTTNEGIELRPGETLSRMALDYTEERLMGFNVQGAVVRDHVDAASLFSLLRSPLAERMTYMVARPNGTVLESGVWSVGNINSSYAPSDKQLGELLARIGQVEPGTVLWAAHNHPSGDPTPSDLDLNVASRMVNFFAPHGVVARNLVLDGTSFAELIRRGHDPATLSPSWAEPREFAPNLTPYTPQKSGYDLLEGTPANLVANPGSSLRVAARLKAPTADADLVLFLDGKHRTQSVSMIARPITPDAIMKHPAARFSARYVIVTDTAQRAREYGAALPADGLLDIVADDLASGRTFSWNAVQGRWGPAPKPLSQVVQGISMERQAQGYTAQDTWLQGWDKTSSKVYEGEGRSAMPRRQLERELAAAAEQVGYEPEEQARSFGSEWDQLAAGVTNMRIRDGLIDRNEADSDNAETLNALEAEWTRTESERSIYALAGRLAAGEEDVGRSAVWRRAMGTVGNQGVTWSVPDNLLRWAQNLFLAAGRWTDALASAGRLTEQNDVRLQETLRKGRTKHRLRQEGEQYVQPLRDAIARSGLDLNDVGEYMLARSLPHRLALITQRRQAPQADYGGYTMQQAAARMAQLDAQSPEFARIADLFDRMNERKLELMVEFGLISQEMADSMRTNEPHYAPWKSDDQAQLLYGEAERPAPRTARTRRKEFKPALGRHTPAENPLVYATMDFVAAIERGMWNSTVGAAALDLARQTNDPAVVTIDTPVMQETLVNGQIRRVPSMALKDNELVVKEGGDPRLLTFQKGWEPVARALKGGRHADANMVLRAMAWATRNIAALSTRWNPAFWPVNWGRDVLGAAFNVAGEQGAKVAAAMFSPKRMASSVKEIVTNGAWYQRYEAAGAPVAFLDVARSVKEHGDRLRKEIEELQHPDAPWTMTKQYGRKIEALLDWSMNVTEQTARLAAFRYAIEVQGMSDARAAAFAKDLTTNFERRGESQMLGALYAFSNAGIQGTDRVARVLSRPGGQVLAGALVAGAFLVSLMNRWIGGEDDDGVPYWDKVPAWIRASNLIVMLPGTEGKRVQIPLPFVWNIATSLGTEIERGAHTGKLEAAKQITSTVANAINPLGGEADIIDTLTPTVADPFLQLERNRDFAGRRIYPERPGLPDSELAWDSTSPFWKDVAQMLNKISGGDRGTPGLVDVSPESLQHILKNLLGGVGGETGRAQRLAEKLLAGEKVGFADIPLWRRYIGEATLSEQREFYRSMKARVDAQVQKEKVGAAYDADLYRLRGRMRALDERIRDLEDKAREATGKEKADAQERLRKVYLQAIKEVRERDQ